MIDNSIPWKATLNRIADDVERRAGQRRWTERTSFLLERDIIIASFAMRKLLDTPGKISHEARGELVQVLSHRLVGSQPDFWNRYEFWEMFDLDQGEQEGISVRELCNRVVHSLVFSFSANEDSSHQLEGIFVASDKSSKKSLTYVEVAELVRVLRIYVNDDVVHLEMVRDDAGGMRITKASREHRRGPE